MIVLALATVVSAGVIVPTVPAVKTVAVVTPIVKTVAVAQPILTKTVAEFDPHPQYKYSYDIQDSISGDSKSQFEERDGDVVRGEYSLIDADGFKRIVQYTADALNGFNAVVRRVPLGHVKTVVKTSPVDAISADPVAPLVVGASTVVKTVAPINVGTPIVKVAHH